MWNKTLHNTLESTSIGQYWKIILVEHIGTLIPFVEAVKIGLPTMAILPMLGGKFSFFASNVVCSYTTKPRLDNMETSVLRQSGLLVVGRYRSGI